MEIFDGEDPEGQEKGLDAGYQWKLLNKWDHFPDCVSFDCFEECVWVAFDRAEDGGAG